MVPDSQEEIIDLAKKLLSYDKETGIFTWKFSRGGKAVKGSKAGTLIAGRRYIKLSRKMHLAHRLAFAINNNRFPENEIDHINGDPDDNRLCNLRECTHFENMQNRKTSGKIGLLGVSKHSCGKYQSNIRINNKQIYLGLFETAELAHEAYKTAKSKLHTFNPTVRS